MFDVWKKLVSFTSIFGESWAEVTLISFIFSLNLVLSLKEKKKKILYKKFKGMANNYFSWSLLETENKLQMENKVI